MYNGLAKDLVEITVSICDLKSERDKLRDELEKVRKENAVLIEKATEAGRAFANGKLAETARLAAEAERERLAMAFDYSAVCADKRATECAQRKDYEHANDNARAAHVWRNAAAECRKPPPVDV